MIFKKIKKIIWILLGIILCLLQSSLISCAINKKMDEDYHKKKYEKTFDASVLNKYYSGQFTLAWDKKSECELTSTKNFKINPLTINDKQQQIKLFNLGNGQFRDKSDFYTIQTIGKNAFKNNKNIGEVLAIPTTIKRIDDGAFTNTTIKNICIKNATNFLPLNKNAFSGCKINKIFTRNNSYKEDPKWNKFCKNIVVKPYKLDDYKNFMSDRTFGIGVSYKIKNEKNETMCKISRGTAWFVDKVNRNDINDYKYWIATNLHICNGITNYNCKDKKDIEYNFFTNEKVFSEEDIIKNLSDWNDVVNGNKKIIKIDVDSVENVKRQKFTSDFCIMKIEFFIDNIPELYKKNTKNWLDSLNHKLLLNNSFVIYTTSILKEGTKVYSLGYPYHAFDKENEKGIKSFDGISIVYFQDAEIYFNKKDYIGRGNNKYHKSIYGIRNVDHSNFGSGSSGSIIIDENFNVVGINFGSMKELESENGYGWTNIAECLYVDDEYNPIATFLKD